MIIKRSQSHPSYRRLARQVQTDNSSILEGCLYSSPKNNTHSRGGMWEGGGVVQLLRPPSASAAIKASKVMVAAIISPSGAINATASLQGALFRMSRGSMNANRGYVLCRAMFYASYAHYVLGGSIKQTKVISLFKALSIYICTFRSTNALLCRVWWAKYQRYFNACPLLY